MINKRAAISYCKNFSKIENYDKAVNDKNEMWVCHHKMEEVFSKEELIRAGWYFDRPASELIFIKRSEHNSNSKIHIEVRRKNEKQKGNKYRLGKHHTEETKKEMSKSRKYKPKSEEQKRKTSETMKYHKVSEETKRKMAEKRRLYWEQKKKS